MLPKLRNSVRTLIDAHHVGWGQLGLIHRLTGTPLIQVIHPSSDGWPGRPSANLSRLFRSAGGGEKVGKVKTCFFRWFS